MTNAESGCLNKNICYATVTVGFINEGDLMLRNNVALGNDTDSRKGGLYG
ncbi:hypothetical protein DJ95_2468 [Bacillus atrophaeus subsp. globigii]|jgi:hypothetical protein|nr:hypothetical protein DJ95_2468 [Bacillus atrophaeus subsp. globigii]KFK81497.1 hypothetical protein DK44_1165 [Bacillus atrophaeus]